MTFGTVTNFHTEFITFEVADIRLPYNTIDMHHIYTFLSAIF